MNIICSHRSEFKLLFYSLKQWSKNWFQAASSHNSIQIEFWLMDSTIPLSDIFGNINFVKKTMIYGLWIIDYDS